MRLRVPGGECSLASAEGTARLWFKRRLATLNAALLSTREGARILLYHSLEGGPMAMPEARFRQQISWLAENMQLGGLDDILDRTSLSGGRGSVAITFDDGYASLAGPALRILSAAGCGATTYLNTTRIGETTRLRSSQALGYYPGEEFLIWDDVERLTAAGWNIGSHGMDHLDLPGLSDRALNDEVCKSKAEIERRLGRPCRHFAYPWGLVSKRVRSAVVQAGYASGAAAYHAPLGASADAFAFPRINVDRAWTMDDFRAVLRGDWDYLGWLQKLRHAKS